MEQDVKMGPEIEKQMEEEAASVSAHGAKDFAHMVERKALFRTAWKRALAAAQRHDTRIADAEAEADHADVTRLRAENENLLRNQGEALQTLNDLRRVILEQASDTLWITSTMTAVDLIDLTVEDLTGERPFETTKDKIDRMLARAEKSA